MNSSHRGLTQNQCFLGCLHATASAAALPLFGTNAVSWNTAVVVRLGPEAEGAIGEVFVAITGGRRALAVLDALPTLAPCVNSPWITQPTCTM